MRSLYITTKSSPHFLQLEKACMQQPRPKAAKNDYFRKGKSKLRKVRAAIADSEKGRSCVLSCFSYVRLFATL